MLGAESFSFWHSLIWRQFSRWISTAPVKRSTGLLHVSVQILHFYLENLICQSYGFSSSLVQMWKLDHKRGWVPKNLCFWVMELEKTLESALAVRRSTVNPKGNKPWIFIGRTDAEAEAPVFRPSDTKSSLNEKTLVLGKIEGKRRRGRQDEMFGWHHGLGGHEFKL